MLHLIMATLRLASLAALAFHFVSLWWSTERIELPARWDRIYSPAKAPAFLICALRYMAPREGIEPPSTDLEAAALPLSYLDEIVCRVPTDTAGESGGASRARTGSLLLAEQAHPQLCYSPRMPGRPAKQDVQASFLLFTFATKREKANPPASYPGSQAAFAVESPDKR